MKQILFAGLAMFIIFFSSCQKEPDQNLPPVTASSRVKTYTEAVTSPYGNLSNTYNIEYDNSGRVTAIIDAASPGDKFLYSYPSANLYKMDLYNKGVLSIHEDFFLNTSAMPDSTLQYNDTRDTTTEGYTYNSNKQLIRLREYDFTKAGGSVLFNTTSYTYDTNGNLVRSQNTDGEIQTYDYYSNLAYIPPVTVGPITIATTRKVNLVKTLTITSNGSTVGSVSYSYTFDDKNRISTERAAASDGSTVTKTYTYF